MLLDPSGLQDVPDGNPLGVEVIAQETAVATPKELLGTHDRSPLATSNPKEPFDTRAELLGHHVVGIVAKADVFETFIG